MTKNREESSGGAWQSFNRNLAVIPYPKIRNGKVNSC